MLAKQDGRNYRSYGCCYHYVCMGLSKSKVASKGEAIMYTKKIGHGCWLSTIRGGDDSLLGD
jgi:hypothetical protein